MSLLGKGLDNLRHRAHTLAKKAYEAVTPVKSTSTFEDDGKITPDEFVLAGDFLVRACPTWSWAAGDESRLKTFLPRDRQFLVTRGVPCFKRANAVLGLDALTESMVEGDGDGEDWVQTGERGGGGSGPVVEIGGEDSDGRIDAACTADEIPDIDALGLDDEAAVRPGGSDIGGQSEHLMRTRTYDLYITYDKSYQTPCFWLVGYDENKQPLRIEQICEDISAEHAGKTVTRDPHPHLGVKCAYIHPCKHAPVMKKLGDMARMSGRNHTVETYLILFLKFISSVVPTIEYDYTFAA